MSKAVSINLAVVSSPDSAAALTNKVFLNPVDASALASDQSPHKEKGYVSINQFVYVLSATDKIPAGSVGLSSLQRQNISASLNEKLKVTSFVPSEENIFASFIKLEIDFFSKNKKTTDKYNAEDIKKVITKSFENQIFSVQQKFVLDYQGVNLSFRIVDVRVFKLKEGDVGSDVESNRGILQTQTEFAFEKAPGSSVLLVGSSSSGKPNIFRPDWNFQNMGIGGLDKEFADIFRRAFASRIFPASVVEKLGIQHVKGILLYGPPGTGKTLMARQIGKMMNGKEPKIVSGPEILDKYVGETERKVRDLFKEAEEEYKAKGEDSELHIIIFDEFDAICKQRGMRNDSTGVGDTVVNQLLAKIDGVERLNNILVIGMTNRKELIDEALLRPGRFGVHVEISLPDEAGRLQVFRIHTEKMRTNKLLEEDVLLEDLAATTKNYSGAEIEEVVKNASSYAFSRQIDPKNMTKPIDPDQIRVTNADFQQALSEVKPAFGVEKDDFENCLRNGIINYGPSVDKILRTGRLFAQQVMNSDRTPLVSVLLEGAPGAGKTALAATLAKDSGFSFIRLLSPDHLVGYNENQKCGRITKFFEDSYRSPLSAIVVDDIERILEYVPIGARFSNAILQTLLVLLKKQPPKGKKLLVIATTNNKELLGQMELLDCFSSTIHVPVISTNDEFRKALDGLKVIPSEDVPKAALSFTADGISIKRLIMLSELARQGEASGTLDRLADILTEYSLA